MLRKKTNGVAGRPRTGSPLAQPQQKSVDRRGFLRGSGLAIGGLAALGATAGTVQRAKAQAPDPKMEIRKSVCTHCSVGCTVLAEVRNGVWVGQEPGWDSPFNLGAHCAKGAAVREHAHGERRLKYPMKLVGGEWTRISWDEAINEIGDGMLQDPRRERPGQRLLARLGQAQQRAGLSVPQVRRLLGHEQRRPPGADLSLDHGRGRCEHMGLRRHDQLLQRHPPLARRSSSSAATRPRRTRSRSSTS